MALIIDIETVGLDFDSLDEITQKSLTRWIERQADTDELKFNVLFRDLKEGLGFSPLTGEIVAIGVFDTERNKGVVYFQAPDVEQADFSDANITFKARTEKEMLVAFWQGVLKYKVFVTFNGRQFDLPFLMIRSAINKVKPSLNLMANRYLHFQTNRIKHIDLFDQLSFYGAVRRKGSLHLFCRAFGIKSPKEDGITGDDVGRLYRDKQYKEIAEYNSWDLIATNELYLRWMEFFQF